MEEGSPQIVHFAKLLAEYCAAGLEALGTIAVVGITAAVTLLALVQLARHRPVKRIVTNYRHGLIRGTLVGLELLVAADIIKTVAIEFDLRGVTTLAILVIIRTFLSFTLEVELSGRWPWQSGEGAHSSDESSSSDQSHQSDASSSSAPTHGD